MTGVRIHMVFLCLILPLTASSQQEQETSWQHSIGLNATGLLHNIFSSEENENTLPYLFTYELEAERMGLRFGLGPQYRSEIVVHEGFTDSQEQTLLDLDGRIGISFRIFEERKWRLSAGADITGEYRLEKTTNDSGFDKITDELETRSIGGGPFLQLTFQPSPRISLRTESALYVRRFRTIQTELFENFPDFNNTLSETTGTVLDTFLPTSVFVHIHF